MAIRRGASSMRLGQKEPRGSCSEATAAAGSVGRSPGASRPQSSARQPARLTSFAPTTLGQIGPSRRVGRRLFVARAAARLLASAAMAERPWDYVIVGGGSAGSVLANRLSADPSTRVLVLEAGRRAYRLDPFIHMPAALAFPIGSRYYDWRYESEPEPLMNGRRIFHARGKVLGGSSSINGMIFQRGNPLDYERWAADPGMATWSYAHCLPYFRRMEDCTAAAPDDPWRGHGGPLGVGRGPAASPLFVAWVEAALPAGDSPSGRRNGDPPGGGAPPRRENPPGGGAAG